MRDAGRVLIASGLACAGVGVVFHNGLVAVCGVVALLAAVLVRPLARRDPRDRAAHLRRPRFGPTTVASTIGGDASRPIDFTPRD
jgi:type IV secretory pathway TrbD component